MKKKLTFTISILWLLGCIAAACVFVAKCGTNFIDSDMSSELVLGKLLSEQGGILAKNWFYSTEIKLLSDQIVFAPLFWIFKSWSTVRTAGSAISFLLLAGACIFTLRAYKLAWPVTFTATGFLFVPLSSSYIYGVLEGIFYIPYIILSILPLGLFAKSFDADSKRKCFVMFTLSLLTALLSGLAGIRQLFVFYIPAAVGAILLLATEKRIEKTSESFRYSVIAVSACAVAVIGYILNKVVLSRIYSFCDYGVDTFGRDLMFTEFSITGLEQFFNQLFEMLGYKTGAMFSGYILYNALFALIALCALLAAVNVLHRSSFDIKEKNLTLTLLMGLVMLLGVFCFTDMDKIGRYGLPVIALLIPLIAVFLSGCETDGRIVALVSAALVCLSAVTGLNTYRQAMERDDNTQIKDVYAYLESEGYEEGYSSFWSGNILTELSDGKIDMRVVGTDYILSTDDLQNVYHWLQRKSHLDTQPQGRFFLLLAGIEADSCKLELTPEYTNDRYRVFGFDSFEDFEALYS